MLNVIILTIFPDMFPGPLGFSLAGKALKNKIWNLDIINIRDFGVTKYKNIDAPACGGGNGLIMRSDVLGEALDHALLMNPDAEIYYPSPRGNTLNQEYVKSISLKKNIIILCGRFEGIDERIIDAYDINQISMGDFVMSGGEIPAMVMLDSVIRLLPGVLINQDTLKDESFEFEFDGMKLIEHPLYTKPIIWRNQKVPDVLMSGNHKEIERWKKSESIRITKMKKKY